MNIIMPFTLYFLNKKYLKNSPGKSEKFREVRKLYDQELVGTPLILKD